MKGKYPRTPAILAKYTASRKAMWAKRTPEQRSAIMSKVAQIQQAKLTPEQLHERITKMNKARKLKYEKQS